MKRLQAIAAAAGLLSSAGCATPQVQNAVQIGNREPATWVFISVSDRSLQGVYRCKETEQGPVCRKAKIEN